MWKSLQLIGLSILLALMISGIILLVSTPPHGSPVIILPTKANDTVAVYINGEVKSPGVYSLTRGNRVSDAIEAAGGLSNLADPSSINLAVVVNDEDFIHVPALGEKVVPTNTVGTTSSDTKGIIATNQKVDVNHATLEELMTLPGIGPVKAQAILTYRTNNGLFTIADDLLKVSGIGPSTLEKIAAYVVINP